MEKGRRGGEQGAGAPRLRRQGAGEAPLEVLRQLRSEWESFHGEYASTRATVVFSRSAKRA
jgi:hypothetical protein